MSDLIKREDAIKAINLRARIPHSSSSAWYADLAVNAICSVPSADISKLDKDIVEPIGNGNVIMSEDTYEESLANRPQGEWIRHFDDIWPEESTIECSECHEEQPMGIDENFCPHCGARMIRQLDAKIVANGNCALCGKPLSDGRLFVCKECEEHIEKGADDE